MTLRTESVLMLESKSRISKPIESKSRILKPILFYGNWVSWMGPWKRIGTCSYWEVPVWIPTHVNKTSFLITIILLENLREQGRGILLVEHSFPRNFFRDGDPDEKNLSQQLRAKNSSNFGIIPLPKIVLGSSHKQKCKWRVTKIKFQIESPEVQKFRCRFWFTKLGLNLRTFKIWQSRWNNFIAVYCTFVNIRNLMEGLNSKAFTPKLLIRVWTNQLRPWREPRNWT